MANVAALDIIKRAQRLIGVLVAGEAPSAEETQDAIDTINGIIDEWSLMRDMCVWLQNYYYNGITAGQGYYTIGGEDADLQPWPGQGISSTDYPRPIEVISSYIRDEDSGTENDYPLALIEPTQWDGICQKKTESTYPQYLMYEADYPEGRVNLWPAPTKEMKIIFRAIYPIERITAPTDEFIDAPLYTNALSYELAVRMAPEYGVEAPPTVRETASKYIADIKRMNHRYKPMKVDRALRLRSRKSSYNIYTDR